MKKISSDSTFFFKKVFPILWFGFLGVFVVLALTQGAGRADALFLIAPVFMATFGFFLMKKVVWDLADEVYDGWEYLVVKNRGYEIQIPLSDIVNVNVVTMMNPPRITLRLRSPTKLGDEISFSPVKRFTLNPFAKNEIAEDLIVRVDRARSSKVV